MVYYLQQNVAILDTISNQLSTIAPQISIPSTPPPPFPAFQPLASDIRVNAFWFMALIFSLSAALLAILVQQWVRDYLHVFQRYNDSLKSARLRQYLHEGSEGWYLPIVAEAVPGLLHVSLFLFFVGLCDFVLNINTTVGLSTTVLIAITGLLYLFTTVARIIYPQSPYQNSFSAVIWYMTQRFGGRRYKDRDSTGVSKSVSLNMAEGQMQLAMEETEGRKGRDERAIRWLVTSVAEDAEMEEFMMAIPGSFNARWGVEVWKSVSNTTEDKSRSRNEPSRMQNVLGSFIRLIRSCTANDSRGNTTAITPVTHPPATTHTHGEGTVRELSARVAHMLETCKNRDAFTSDTQWQKRTRACIEATASLVCCAGAELGQFGDIVKLLGDIGKDQKVRESSSVGKEQSFVMHWTCLALVAIRPILASNRSLHDDARLASQRLGRRDITGEEQTRADKIVETLDNALGYLKSLSDALIWGGVLTEERVREIFRAQESQISKLEQIDIDIEHGGFQLDDWSISSVQNFVDQITHEVITRQLPGVHSDFYDAESVNFSQFVELFRGPHALLFILPLRNLKRIRSFARTIRHHLEGPWDVNTSQEMIKNLREFGSLFKQWDNPSRRQVWRLQDLSGGGGLGFTVELFFLSFKQLLSDPSSNESHSALVIGTFRAITSDWSKYRRSLGAQKLLLDMVTPQGGVIFDFDYPAYIVDEFLALLGNILGGQAGPHIDDAMQRLAAVQTYSRRYALSIKVLAVIRERTSS
jgi:hypothetical protein